MKTFIEIRYSFVNDEATLIFIKYAQILLSLKIERVKYDTLKKLHSKKVISK